MKWKDGSRKDKESILRDFFKYPPGIGGKDQERQIREARRVWKRELHRYQRRSAKKEISRNNEKANLEVVCGNCHIKRHLKLVDGEWMFDSHALTPRELLSEL